MGTRLHEYTGYRCYPGPTEEIYISVGGMAIDHEGLTFCELGLEIPIPVRLHVYQRVQSILEQ